MTREEEESQKEERKKKGAGVVTPNVNFNQQRNGNFQNLPPAYRGPPYVRTYLTCVASTMG